MDKVFKILVINPGSTSTKIEYFENEKSVVKANVFHDSSILLGFPTINDQLDYRVEVVKQWIKDNNLDLTGVDAIVGRGGSCYPLIGGTYNVDDRLISDIRNAVGGIYHSSMLGVQMAEKFHDIYGGKMYTVDPIMVDEYEPVARITGVKGIYRTSAIHALNQKATARAHAHAMGKRYRDVNLICCHIDGGMTIVAHRKGKMIDSNDGSGGDGPMTPTRMGSMAITDVVRLLYDTPKEEMRKLCSAAGGLSSWFGTSNADTVHDMVVAGDEKAKIVWEAMTYQICKQIGSMATVLKGEVDGIVLTGGLMRFQDIIDQIQDRCGWIAPIAVYPDEMEHEAMRDGALRVLRGEEEALTYTGEPVFKGFDF